MTPDTYVSAKAAIWKEGKLLLQKEMSSIVNDYVYDLPGGTLAELEDPIDALKREVKEEIGVEVRKVSDLPIKVWSAMGKDEARLILVYEVELESEDFDYTSTDQDQEVFEAKFLEKEEFEKTNSYGYTSFILELYDQHRPK